MKSNQKEMIAALLKEGRIAKGYTQKELSELSNISIRSIQRIENGDILPRTYTLKTLAGILEQPFERFSKILQSQSFEKDAKETDNSPTLSINKKQLIILSVGTCFAIIFLSLAFIAQSPGFPETTFELLVFCAIVLLLVTGILFLFWRNK
ncbi:MAG: helix-turn-helix domain-containing protein [Chitinophagaceae bacterium]